MPNGNEFCGTVLSVSDGSIAHLVVIVHNRDMMYAKSDKQTSPTEVGELLAPLFTDPSLRLVVLFGSVVSGKTHGTSDVDLGFVFDRPIDVVDLTNRVTSLLRRNDVDVVDLGRASPLLKYNAARGGIALYERTPGLFAEFYSLSYRMYVDTKKLRDAGNRYVENFLRSRERS